LTTPCSTSSRAACDRLTAPSPPRSRASATPGRSWPASPTTGSPASCPDRATCLCGMIRGNNADGAFDPVRQTQSQIDPESSMPKRMRKRATDPTDLLARITSEPGRCGGRPCIRDLRIRVIDVLELIGCGMSTAQIVRQYTDLEPDDVRACA